MPNMELSQLHVRHIRVGDRHQLAVISLESFVILLIKKSNKTR